MKCFSPAELRRSLPHAFRMFPGAFVHLNSGYTSSIKTILRKNFTQVAFHHYLSPRSKPFNSFRVIIGDQTSSIQTSHLFYYLRLRYRLFHYSHRCSNQFSSSPKTDDSSLGTRLKRLSREYGWSAFGVYLALSALDFPFCYLLVRYLGSDKIGEWEYVIVSNVKHVIPEEFRNLFNKNVEVKPKSKQSLNDPNESNEGLGQAKSVIEEIEQTNKKDASLATQLALAYAIHKSFIFVRVPLTAAITPKIVKILRSWGWDIGKRTSKEAKALKRAALGIKAQTPSVKKRLLGFEKLARFKRSGKNRR